MSVSQETLEMITAAIKNGANTQGTLVRSKLTNRLVWNAGENDENDPYGEYLTLIGASGEGRKLQNGKPEPEQVHGGGRVVLEENQAQVRGGGSAVRETRSGGRKNGSTKHDKENWRDQWEMLKKAGNYCSLCKNNKEGREIYLSHNLKGPNGEVTCPILLECVCQCCGKLGHTIAYCPENETGTSVLKMINRHNRI